MRTMRLRITINGRTYVAEVEVLEEGERGPEPAVPSTTRGAAAPPPSAPATPAPTAPAGDPVGAGPVGGTEVKAALPGVVTEVRVRPGQSVAAGDVLLVLEAMKMDNDVVAPVAGTVRAVLVGRGDQVAAQQTLALISS